MNTRWLIKKAFDLVLYGRMSKDVKTKNDAFDGLWEILINMEYEIRMRNQTISPN